MEYAFAAEVPALPHKTWISMALCLDETTTLHGPLKARFPYFEAAYWATKLWHTVTNSSVIITIVSQHADWERDPAVLHLQQTGALIQHHNITAVDAEYGCVAIAQVARMYAFRHSAVKDDDIIVVSDADSFPTMRGVLDPLKEYPTVHAWIWQYFYTVESTHTFPLSFVALRAKKWEEILTKQTNRINTFANATLHQWHSNTLHGETCAGCPPPMLSRQAKMVAWGLDQRIVTRALLAHKVCSIDNKVTWARVGMRQHYKTFDDRRTCWHGERRHGNAAFAGSRSSWMHLDVKLTMEEIGHVARDILQSATQMVS